MVKQKKFHYKLWRVVNESRTNAVQWSPKGDSVIFNFSKFKKEYLDPNDNFCKSNYLSSFVRQLNLYGFKKVIDLAKSSVANENEKEYANENFVRGRSDLLRNVYRKDATLNEQKIFIKREIDTDDEDGKENTKFYIAQKSKRTSRKSGDTLNGCLYELRRSRRRKKKTKLDYSSLKQPTIKEEKKNRQIGTPPDTRMSEYIIKSPLKTISNLASSLEQSFFKETDVGCEMPSNIQCCSYESDVKMPEYRIRSQSFLKKISNNSLQGKVIPATTRIAQHSTAKLKKNYENMKNPLAKSVSDHQTSVRTNDESNKRSNLWFCEYNCPDYFLPKASLPPRKKKKSPKSITTDINCVSIRKPEVVKILKNPNYRFTCPTDDPFFAFPTSKDVILSASCLKETAILAAPPKSAFHFDVSCLADFDQSSVDWSTYYNLF